MGSLLAELKRRKVFRVAAVYAVVAWLLIQVADVVLPTFGAPAWVNQTLIFLFFIGFPIALVLAWAYESTPEGIKPDHEVQASPGPRATSAQPINYLILLVVLVVAGIQLFTTLGGNTATSTTIDSASVEASPALPPATVMRAAINLVHPLPRVPIGRPRISLQLTADGSQLLYNTYTENGNSLRIRDLASQSSRTMNISLLAPRLSPFDDRIVGALPSGSGFALHRLSGGGQQTVETRIGVPVSNWLSETEILFTPPGFYESLSIQKLYLLSGEITTVTAAESTEVHDNPWVLPGSTALLFNSSTWFADGNESAINIHDLESGLSRTLVNGGYYPQYSPSGHIVFIRNGNLWAVPFDLDRRELTGPEVQVIEGIESYPEARYAAVTFSDNGRLVYLSGEEYTDAEYRLHWTDRSGNAEAIRLPTGRYTDPELSSSGDMLALTVTQDDGSSDIWTHDLRRGTLTRLTLSGNARNPKWSPDSSSLVYQIPGQGIWQVRANGTGAAEQLVTQADARPDSFSVDGATLFYLQGTVGNADIMRLDFRDDALLSAPFLDEPYNEWGVAMSPDGNWIAYVSDESGSPEVFVRPYPNIDDGKWQISTATGREPKWTAQGDELVYVQIDDAALMSVQISSSNGFEASIPRPVIDDISINQPNPPSYAMTADGGRFIYVPRQDLAEEPEQVDFPQLTVVENWFDELNRLAPTTPSN